MHSVSNGTDRASYGDSVNTSTTTSLFSMQDHPGLETASASQRREIKYALPLADLQKLRSILEVNCQRIVFDKMSTDVSSIYFDDHALSACHENINGVERRGKLRLRWYDDHDTKFFYEVKRRLGNILEKRRLAIESSVALRPLGFREIQRNLSRVLPSNETALLMARSEPILMTCYKREHFASHETPIRITLDYDIRCYDQTGAKRVRTSFGVPLPDLVVIEGKAPVGAETDLPYVLAPLRPVLTKSSKYVMGCRLLGLVPGHHRDAYE